MLSTVVRIAAPEGLHARPAARFVQAVKSCGADVTVAKGDRTADASSILGVITLGVFQGDEVTLTVSNDDSGLLDRLAEMLAREH